MKKTYYADEFQTLQILKKEKDSITYSFKGETRTIYWDNYLLSEIFNSQTPPVIKFLYGLYQIGNSPRIFASKTMPQEYKRAKHSNTAYDNLVYIYEWLKEYSSFRQAAINPLIAIIRHEMLTALQNIYKKVGKTIKIHDDWFVSYITAIPLFATEVIKLLDRALGSDIIVYEYPIRKLYPDIEITYPFLRELPEDVELVLIEFHTPMRPDELFSIILKRPPNLLYL